MLFWINGIVVDSHMRFLFETPYFGGGSFTHSINVCLDLKRFINNNKKIIIYTNFEKKQERPTMI